jgi:hypothetical protein
MLQCVMVSEHSEIVDKRGQARCAIVALLLCTAGLSGCGTTGAPNNGADTSASETGTGVASGEANTGDTSVGHSGSTSGSAAGSASTTPTSTSATVTNRSTASTGDDAVSLGGGSSAVTTGTTGSGSANTASSISHSSLDSATTRSTGDEHSASGDVTSTNVSSNTNGSTDSVAPNDFYPCDSAQASDYDVVAIKSGDTWTVTKAAQEVYSGTEFQSALTSAYGALTQGRSAKESILVLGDGELAASVQLGVPSNTIINVCGTVDVTGTPSGSDRSPFYARNANNIDIPNLKLTGSPQYGIFFRQTNNVHLGQIELRLTRDAGIGIRVDSGPNAGSTLDFNTGLTIDHVYGTGMGSHVVETYGIDGVNIGSVEGQDVGECGLLLNRSIHAEVGSVTCTDCATGTGYAAFRVANSVGKVGDDFPAGNIHVGKVTARGGGRGIFSVSGCGGLVIDEIDIADTGNTSILLQNTYNSVIAAQAGLVSGGVVQLTNDTDNTNEGVYPPSQDVTLQNLTLSNGASVRQDWCNEFGSNGCSASNITGGSVSMCE